MEPSDRVLARLAQSGDVNALAGLLGRHRAAMVAVAHAVLGSVDVEDVVQDACLVAVRDVHRITNPDSARAWLCGITRNLSRARQRGRKHLHLDETLVGLVEAAPDVIERSVMRDWVWASLNGLSHPLREVVVLRYFSQLCSYDAMAEVLGIPVGTVRSRLAAARRDLADRLRLLEEAAWPDQAAYDAEQERLFATIASEHNRGIKHGALHTLLAGDACLTEEGSDERWQGPTAIVNGLTPAQDAGVRLRILGVVADRRLTVVEGEFINPVESPDHCPSRTTQVYRRSGDAIMAMHLAYSAS